MENTFVLFQMVEFFGKWDYAIDSRRCGVRNNTNMTYIKSSDMCFSTPKDPSAGIGTNFFLVRTRTRVQVVSRQKFI